MTEIDTGAGMVAGPRGRRLCWTLVEPQVAGTAWRRIPFEDRLPPSAELAAEIAATADAVVLDEGLLFEGLRGAVDWAWYWQEPDRVDRALALPDVRDALRSLARRVVAAAPAWWSEPVDLDRQRVVEWLDLGITTSLSGAAGKLTAWRAATVEDELRAVDRPDDVRAPYSGHWWSTPALSGLPATTRALPELGAAGLALVEDGMGWDAARCRPVAPSGSPRIAEIGDAGAWVDLVARYPLDVTRSRRHDWWRATGVDGSWLVPDYAAVGADYDAVHLSVCAYVTGAGRALPVGAAHTVIAGWDPDQTWWLADQLAPSGEPEHWGRTDGGWARVPAASGS